MEKTKALPRPGGRRAVGSDHARCLWPNVLGVMAPGTAAVSTRGDGGSRDRSLGSSKHSRDGTGTLPRWQPPDRNQKPPTGKGKWAGLGGLAPGGRHTGLAQVRKPLLISHHTQQGSRWWADSRLARAWRMTDAATLAPAGVVLWKHQVLADTRGCADVLCSPSV